MYKTSNLHKTISHVRLIWRRLVEFVVWKKKWPPPIVNTFFEKNVEKLKTDVRVAIGTFMEKKFTKKCEKNFFNKSVNLSTKFSKKSIFDEKWQKIPPDQQWVGVKKVVFRLLFSYYRWFYIKKQCFFEVFASAPKQMSAQQ